MCGESIRVYLNDTELTEGMKVRIKSDLVAGEVHGDIEVTEEMANLAGQVAEITWVYSDGDMEINLDDEAYYWSVDMFEEVVEE